MIPPGGPGDFILVMGQGGPADPSRYERLGYGRVINSDTGYFDLERDFYPYPSAHFKTILCFDLLETLAHDPMHMMDEIHRVLRPACHLVLTTRRFTRDQIRSLLENCGLEVTLLESREERVCAVARKVGILRERYPGWLYPGR
jgi:SAM-dependent methyltransferase